MSIRAGTAAAIAGAAGLALVAIAVGWLLLDPEGGPRVPRPDSRETAPLPEKSPRPGPEQPPPAVIHPRSTASLAGIEGVIRDDNGEAVEGAEIAIEHVPEPTAMEESAFPGGLSMHVRSDAEGRFALKDLAPGLYHCFAQGSGLGWKIARVRVDEGRATPLTFILVVRPEATWQVVDATGNPVEGADVVVRFESRRPGRRGTTAWVVSRTTVAGGWFAFPAPSAPRLGAASVEADKPGVGHGAGPLLLPMVPVRLNAARRLTLRFSRADGGPAPARVPFEVWGGQYRHSGATDSAGRVRFPDLPAIDGLSLTVHDPKWLLDPGAVRSNWRHFDIERKGDVELAVPLTGAPGVADDELLKPGPAAPPEEAPERRVGPSTEVPIGVEVVGLDGRRVPKVLVVVAGDRDGDPSVTWQGWTGEDGRLSGPAPLWGRVSIDVDPASLPPGTGVDERFDGLVEIEDSARAPITIGLRPQTIAAGTVAAEDGTSLEGGVIRFSVNDAAYEGRERYARIGRGGRFRIALRSWRQLVPAQATVAIGDAAAGRIQRLSFEPVDPVALVPDKENFIAVKKRP